ncbi:uncharacterized protein METZ01_LOCUS295527, partial [marine metagenome]
MGISLFLDIAFSPCSQPLDLPQLCCRYATINLTDNRLEHQYRVPSNVQAEPHGIQHGSMDIATGPGVA